MNLNFEVVVFLPTFTLADGQNKMNAWWGGKWYCSCTIDEQSGTILWTKKRRKIEV